MFKEMILFKPKLDTNDLKKMETSLSTRFGKVAKKFGKGLIGAVAGGGILGLASSLIDKLLNPLKETQEAIDKTLSQADDVVTNAAQFNSTAGKLFKLQKFAQAAGLDPNSLDVLITKFSTAVAEAQVDPNKDTSVRAFVNQKDTVDAFFNFIQSLQKMDKTQQLLVQQEVFGEKQILKMADFLQSDFAAVEKMLKLRTSAEYDAALGKQALLNDLKDTLEARRDAEDKFKKAGLINSSMIFSQDRQAQIELDKENRRIQSYKSLAIMQEASGKILSLLENGYMELADIATRSRTITDFITKFSVSRAIKGIKSSVGKGD